MLQKHGIQVSLHRTVGNQEFPGWWRQRASGLPIEVFSTGDAYRFYPIVKLTPAFRYEPNVNALKIKVRHNQHDYDILVELEQPKSSAAVKIDLGDYTIIRKPSSIAMPLKRALFTGVSDLRIPSISSFLY